MQSDCTTTLKLVPATAITVQKYSVASRPTQHVPGEVEKIPFLDQILQCLVIGTLALAAYWIVSHKLLQSIEVEGRSMVPTLKPAEQYLLNRWIYSMRSPQHDDIVVLKDPQDEVLEVKRVIATAGESVHIKRGAVYVNGRLLKEPYLSPGTQTFAADTAEEFICCGRNQYYVLGDNRSNSRDSRYFGPIKKDSIVGKLIH